MTHFLTAMFALGTGIAFALSATAAGLLVANVLGGGS
jgi:biopolymer transport protein ExbB/TolQ